QFEEVYGSLLNFQLWFKENGIIEIHFGSFDLDDHPVYEVGKGFHCYDDNGVYPEICGTYIQLYYPNNPNYNFIGFHGNHLDYEVVDNFSGDPTKEPILTEIPPPGWVIRFVPRTV